MKVGVDTMRFGPDSVPLSFILSHGAEGSFLAVDFQEILEINSHTLSRKYLRRIFFVPRLLALNRVGQMMWI